MKYNTQLSYYGFLEHNTGPGVYRINLLSTGKYYIGSSKDVRKRVQQHMGFAKYFRHTIREINDCYSEFGKDGFTFELLCSCSINDLLKLEGDYQEAADDNLLIRKQVVRRVREKQYKEKPARSLEHISGEIVEFTSITEFCRERDLSIKSVSRLLNHLSKTHKGWYRLGETPVKTIPMVKEPKTDKRVSTRTLVDPEGKEHMITNIAEFCREKGFNLGGFSDMLRGKQKSYRGWRLPGVRTAKPAPLVSGTLYHIDGRKEVFNSISEVCKKHGLSTTAISRVLSGELLQHKEWYKPGVNAMVYSFQHPDHGTHYCWKATELCRKFNLKYCYVQRVVSGERKTYNGWCIKKVHADTIRSII